MKKKIAGISALVLTFSMILSSCSLFGGSKKKDEDDSDLNEDIVEVVEGYFKTLSKGNVKKLDKYTEDTAFAETEDYSADQTAAFLAFAGKIKCSVEEAEGSEKKGEGTATVKLTFPDAETIAAEHCIDGGLVQPEELISALEDKKAKTVKKEIDIDLVYDDGWTIEDDSPIYKVLVKDSFQDIVDMLDETSVPTPIPTSEATTEATTEATEPSEKETTPATSDPSQGGSETDDSDPSSSTKDTTKAPDNNPPFETQAGPGIGDRHIVSADEFDKLMKEYRFTSNDESEDGYIMREYTIDADDMYVTYLEFEDSEELRANQEFLDEMIDEILYEDLPLADGTVSDRWDKNTHNVYSQKISSMDNHSIDVYVYRDATTVAIIAIDEYPNADVSVDYYMLIEKLGIWDFDMDID